MWKFHNKDFALESAHIKELFMTSLKRALKKETLTSKVKMSAFCVMDNHVHKILTYRETSKFLSKIFQITLTRFARIFNDTHQRSGAVGNGRVKTILIQDTDAAQMRAHMYIEANPIRATMKKFENLKTFQFNSFRFYAYGIIDKFTAELEHPDWYLKLGNTAALRQARYRSLFKAYIDKEIPDDQFVSKKALFFGELAWLTEQLARLKRIMRKSKTDHSQVIPGSYVSSTASSRTGILKPSEVVPA